MIRSVIAATTALVTVVVLTAAQPGPTRVQGSGRPDLSGLGTGYYRLPVAADPQIGPRYYRLQAELGAVDPRPLVILLHGAGQTSDNVRNRLAPDFGAFAVTHRIVLAYGEGWLRSWNAGPPCCGDALAEGVDDVAYIRAMVADVERRVPVDRRRIYVVGFSNGAMMAARAVADIPGVFAGACMVAGDVLVPVTRPIRLCDFHDPDHDITVPYSGGRGYGGLVFPPVSSIPHRLPAGSVWVEFPMHQGHSWPSGVTRQMWSVLSGWVGPI